MKLIYEFDENEILEKVKETGSYDLKDSIIRELKAQAVNSMVNDITRQMVAKDYWQKERIADGMSALIIDKINPSIERFVSEKLSEVTLSAKIEKIINDKLDEWVSDKIYKKLEKIKADIYFGSTEERNQDEDDRARAEEDSYREEF